jgi:hypothetical protein
VAYTFWGDQINKLLRGNVLLSQVTPIVQVDQDYLLNLPDALKPLTAAEVASAESIQQRFIETLYIHVNEFDETNVGAAMAFLQEYYKFPLPIPLSVETNIKAAADKFIITYPLFAAGNSTTGTPAVTAEGDYQAFLDQLITILANHQVSTNNYQSVKRAQTLQSLADAFVNQL